MEVFNLLNRDNLSLPSRVVFPGRAEVEAVQIGVGQITSTVGEPRQFQFSLRFSF
jgi:hypothetical protein